MTIAPRAAEIDCYAWDARELLASNDVLGLLFDTEVGGTGTRTLVRRWRSRRSPMPVPPGP